MQYLPAILIALATTCALSAPVVAQGLSAPGAPEKVVSGRPVDPTGEVFIAPPLRWEYWCTCRCGDLYHKMDVPTPACEDLNTKECVLNGRKHGLEDCARRLTPKDQSLFPR
jgi:hypothetical protein